MHAAVQDRPIRPDDTARRPVAQRRQPGRVRRWTLARPTSGTGSGLPPVHLEVLLLTVLYGAYAASRSLVDQAPEQALRNGWAVLRIERLIGLDVERAAIDWLIQWTWSSVVASYAYAALHYTITPAVLVWLYARRPAQYRQARLGPGRHDLRGSGLLLGGAYSAATPAVVRLRRRAGGYAPVGLVGHRRERPPWAGVADQPVRRAAVDARRLGTVGWCRRRRPGSAAARPADRGRPTHCSSARPSS
jgi:hypothetical protein